jgi:hypothetical protein
MIHFSQQQVLVANTRANNAEDESFETSVELKESEDKRLQREDYESHPQTWESFRHANIHRDLRGDYKRSKEFKDLVDKTLCDIAYELHNARTQGNLLQGDMVDFVKTVFYSRHRWYNRAIKSISMKTESSILRHLKSGLHYMNDRNSSRHISFALLHQKCQETVDFLRENGVEKENVLLSPLNDFAIEHGIEIPNSD